MALAIRPVPLWGLLALVEFDDYVSRLDKGHKGSGCRNHPEDTQVFGKPRRTPDAVASLSCGERFTILQFGFIFSRIETKDGKVGYVYSNLIAVDHSGATVLQPASARVPVATSNPPSTAAVVVQPNPATATQPQPTPAQPATAQAPGATLPGATLNVPEAAAAVVQPNPPAPAQPQPAPAQPAPAQVRGATIDAPETAAAVVQPNPPAPAEPEASPAQPAAPAVRPANVNTSWEKPNPPSVRRTPLIELYGGYAFARLGGAGTWSNLNGALGSFGWNVKPWLQIVADTSYSYVTANGVKNVLYGNHYGPRFFRHGRNRWGATPFVEALFGGSRADTTITGTGGYTSSENSLSFKVGGGLDIHPSPRLKIRLFDVDYYRTSFGPNLHQNNYWASAGIVARLFGGSSE